MDADREEQVSPELVLVDPALRERLLRESLAELLLAAETSRRQSRAPRAIAVSREAAVIAPAPSVPGRGRRRRRHVRVGSVSTAVIAALLLALPSLAFLPPTQAPRLGSVVSPIGSTHSIAWQRDPAADSYRFELVADGHVVLTRALTRPEVTLDGGIAPGRYVWRVYAVTGPTDSDARSIIAGGTIELG